METWRTYAPDGRILEVEYAAGEWVARCGGTRAVAATALEAVTEAVGSEGNAIGRREPSLQAWLRTHAARLEAEVAG